MIKNHPPPAPPYTRMLTFNILIHIKPEFNLIENSHSALIFNLIAKNCLNLANLLQLFTIHLLYKLSFVFIFTCRDISLFRRNLNSVNSNKMPKKNIFESDHFLVRKSNIHKHIYCFLKDKW